MSDEKEPATREERLAAKLRANLRRRKAHAGKSSGEPGQSALPNGREGG